MATLTIDGVEVGVLQDGPAAFHLQELAAANGLGQVLTPSVTVATDVEVSALFVPGMAKRVLETRVEFVVIFRQFDAVAITEDRP